MLLLLLSHFSHVQLFVTLWTVARQAPLSMGFPRQEYWSGFPDSQPGDLSDPGVEPETPALQVDSLPSKLPGKPNNHVFSSVQSLSRVRLFVTPLGLTHQAPLSMGFPRQK